MLDNSDGAILQLDNLIHSHVASDLTARAYDWILVRQ